MTSHAKHTVLEVVTLFQSSNLITTHYGALTLMEEHYLPVRGERHNRSYLEEWSPFIFPIKPCMTQRCDCVCDAGLSVSVSFRHCVQLADCKPSHLLFGSIQSQRGKFIASLLQLYFSFFIISLTILFKNVSVDLLAILAAVIHRLVMKDRE